MQKWISCPTFRQNIVEIKAIAFITVCLPSLYLCKKLCNNYKEFSIVRNPLLVTTNIFTNFLICFVLNISLNHVSFIHKAWSLVIKIHLFLSIFSKHLNTSDDNYLCFFWQKVVRKLSIPYFSSFELTSVPPLRWNAQKILFPKGQN